jgi:hypothetical protein
MTDATNTTGQVPALDWGRRSVRTEEQGAVSDPRGQEGVSRVLARFVRPYTLT